MKLNCKQGDIARYVGVDQKCYGFVVLCVELDPHCELATGQPGWVTSPPMPRLDGLGDARAVWDSVLRPIGNPGDDARDESLSWLPLPSREEVTV